MSDGSEHTLTADSLICNGGNSLLNQVPGKSSRTPTSALSSRSASSSSLSEKSSSALSSIELGFNCDSPEGGTIKKKPSLVNSAKSSGRLEEPKKTVQVCK